MVKPKNASRQVPEWRLMITESRKPDEERLPTRPFWRHWQRQLDDEYQRWERKLHEEKP